MALMAVCLFPYITINFINIPPEFIRSVRENLWTFGGAIYSLYSFVCHLNPEITNVTELFPV